MVKFPRHGTGTSKTAFILIAIGIFILGCVLAQLLDVLAAKIFGW